MSSQNKTGKVYLIGAGPGDPGLVTVRARELIEAADVIVYDYLANPQLLKWARADSEQIYVGKRSGMHSIPQDEIEEILVEHAHKGRQVVRLKGGDPFVFGRGGEEISELQLDKIPFEIVPGVTAALAAAAYAGIPLSHRDFSSSITFLTGHEDPEKQTISIDFKLHAQSKGTLCLYMGLGNCHASWANSKQAACVAICLLARSSGPRSTASVRFTVQSTVSSKISQRQASAPLR